MVCLWARGSDAQGATLRLQGEPGSKGDRGEPGQRGQNGIPVSPCPTAPRVCKHVAPTCIVWAGVCSARDCPRGSWDGGRDGVAINMFSLGSARRAWSGWARGEAGEWQQERPGPSSGAQSPFAVRWPLRAGPPVSSGGVWCLVAQVQAHMSDGCVCARARVYCP